MRLLQQVDWLSLKEEDVKFLEYRDGELIRNEDSAMHKVTEILQRQRPDEIFIPYPELKSIRSEDHLATNRSVLHAVRASEINAIVYEYPVSFWYHWPWVSVPMRTAMRASVLRVCENYVGFCEVANLICIEQSL